MNILNLITTNCDAPQPWGLYFQDSASPQMEALIELHDNIMFYLVIILFGVAWIMVSIIRNYVVNKSPISNKYLNHGTLIELIWTITPALILILIAFPSFKLLYLMDEVTDPSLTVFVEGHQWYWSYQYPDFTNDENEEVEFDSYLVLHSDLKERQLYGNYEYYEITDTHYMDDEVSILLGAIESSDYANSNVGSDDRYVQLADRLQRRCDEVVSRKKSYFFFEYTDNINVCYGELNIDNNSQDHNLLKDVFPKRPSIIPRLAKGQAFIDKFHSKSEYVRDNSYFWSTISGKGHVGSSMIDKIRNYKP